MRVQCFALPCYAICGPTRCQSSASAIPSRWGVIRLPRRPLALDVHVLLARAGRRARMRRRYGFIGDELKALLVVLLSNPAFFFNHLVGYFREVDFALYYRHDHRRRHSPKGNRERERGVLLPPRATPRGRWGPPGGPWGPRGPHGPPPGAPGGSQGPLGVPRDP